MSESHRLATAQHLMLQDVANAYHLERLGCEFGDYLDLTMGEALPDFNVVFAGEREDWIQALTISGQGIAIVPEAMGA